MGFSRQEYWNGLPFPSPVDHILSDLSTMTCPLWVAPRAWLSFIELDNTVVLVWLDWLVFCEYGFSVSALWCPLATSTILLGFLLPWAWSISSWLLQKSAAAAPYLGQGYVLTAALPDLQCGMAPIGPPAPTQPPLLGRGVPNMLLEISGEITPERMKGWSQSKNNTQLWMWLVIEPRSDAVKSNIV